MSGDSGEQMMLVPMLFPVSSWKLLEEAASKHGRSLPALLSEAIKDKVKSLDESVEDEEDWPWTS